jgi:hypothetical protein
MSSALSWDTWLAPLRDGKWRRFSDLWRRAKRDNLAEISALGALLTKDMFRRVLRKRGADRCFEETDGHEMYCLHPLRLKSVKRSEPAKPPITRSYELAFSLLESGGCVFTSSTHHGETTVKLLCYGLPTKIKLEPMRMDGNE